MIFIYIILGLILLISFVSVIIITYKEDNSSVEETKLSDNPDIIFQPEKKSLEQNCVAEGKNIENINLDDEEII